MNLLVLDFNVAGLYVQENRQKIQNITRKQGAKKEKKNKIKILKILKY